MGSLEQGSKISSWQSSVSILIYSRRWAHYSSYFSALDKTRCFNPHLLEEMGSRVRKEMLYEALFRFNPHLLEEMGSHSFRTNRRSSSTGFNPHLLEEMGSLPDNIGTWSGCYRFNPHLLEEMGSRLAREAGREGREGFNPHLLEEMGSPPPRGNLHVLSVMFQSSFTRGDGLTKLVPKLSRKFSRFQSSFTRGDGLTIPF